jgi:SWI/SNF-related matrix-associated actin-dependent regulator 1 of chromatin subfamily A
MERITPYKYQTQIAETMSARPHSILGADMGTGKTVMSLLTMINSKIEKLLVLCPAIAVPNWQREAQRIGYTGELQVYSYDKARQKKNFQKLRDWQPQGVILDEAHYLKNPETQRTKLAYGARGNGEGGLVEGAEKVLALSGTICPNNSSELYPHMKFFQPEAMKGVSFWMFRQHFCKLIAMTMGNRRFEKVVGNKNVDELKALLAPVYIPLRAASVLKDLPPITYRTAVLDPGSAISALAKLEKEMSQSKLSDCYYVLEHAEEMELPYTERTLPPLDEHLARLRRMIGEAKVPLAADYIREMLEGSKDKIIVFAYHKNVIDELLRVLTSHTKPVSITGSTSLYQRNQAMEKFRIDPECRVFVGQIQACGTAVTLNSANHVVFLEQSWVPAENFQASKRCHRIGQDKPVFVTNLMLANSIDVAIVNTLAGKTAMLSELDLCA